MKDPSRSSGWAKAVTALAVLPLLAACEGSGSDIGPRLTPLPQESSKVNVYDDQNRGVVGATVTLANTGISAVTGRNGRGELFANPVGRFLVRVDGQSGAAVSGDLLTVLAAAMTLPGGDVPAVFHLPDASAGGSVTLAVGTQTGSSGLGNPPANGGTTQIPAMTSIGVSGGASSVTVRTGSLQAQHLPGDLPAGVLLGRGLYVDPPDVTFSPGADFSVTDDLGAAGTVTLYRLDNATGEWVDAGIGTAGGGAISASAGITTGGLYAFGVQVTTGSVRGRILDADGDPVRDAIVTVDGRRARSDGGGAFVVFGVPAQAGDGSPRDAVVEVFAGGAWLPAIATATVTMNGAFEADAGDIVLDTMPATNIRVQQIKRARAERFRRARISSLVGGVALASVGDGNGQVIFEDVPSRWFGFQDGFPKDRFFAFYSQSVGFAPEGLRWLDAFQFFDESGWFIGSRSSRVLVTDSIGGGPIFDAAVVRGSTPGGGLAGRTREGGVIFTERSMEGRATVSVRTERPGREITHAVSIDTPNGEHLEMPLQRALRSPLGAFDRHGVVTGAVSPSVPETRLRTMRRIELDEWWDDVVEGIPIPSSLPIDVAPTVANAGAFRAGLDPGGGTLLAAEVTTSGSVTLQRLALADDVVPVEGAVVTRDLSLDHTASTIFAAPGALAQLDPALLPTLSASLALGRPSGLAVDVARDLTGNHAVNGGDVTLTLPPLAGGLAEYSWVALVRGSAAIGAATVTQSVLLRFDAGGPTTAPAVLPPPVISSPAPGATVGSTGFPVEFTLPAGTFYAVLELRSDSGGELLLWQAYLPATANRFDFVLLPAEARSPLLSNRSYSLKLSAYASSTNGGVLATSDDPYRDVTTYLQSIGAVERGIDAVSSVTIVVTSL